MYIDTSVLLVYTLAQALEKDRVPATETFFAKIAAGSLLGATSFYALHEVHIFALENVPDFSRGSHELRRVTAESKLGTSAALQRQP